MIDLIIQLLVLSDYYNVSESIDIAKGKYEVPLTFRKYKSQLRR